MKVSKALPLRTTHPSCCQRTDRFVYGTYMKKKDEKGKRGGLNPAGTAGTRYLEAGGGVAAVFSVNTAATECVPYTYLPPPVCCSHRRS